MREKSFRAARRAWCFRERRQALKPIERWASALDRKSTRLNSSHSQISYAVFCLKKKKKHSAEYIILSCISPLQKSTLFIRYPLYILLLSGHSTYILKSSLCDAYFLTHTVITIS